MNVQRLPLDQCALVVFNSLCLFSAIRSKVRHISGHAADIDPSLHHSKPSYTTLFDVNMHGKIKECLERMPTNLSNVIPMLPVYQSLEAHGPVSLPEESKMLQVHPL